MVRSSKERAILWAVCSALVVLLIGSLLPIWTAWHINPWEGVGYRATLWQAIAQLPSNVQNAAPYPGLFALHETNIVQGAILLVLVGAIGVGFYWRSIAAANKRFPR
jgi:hypothetical protein